MVEFIERHLRPIKNKIFLLIGRAILQAVNADEKTMKIQVSGLKDEVITDVERLQEYGFDSYPAAGTSEAVLVFPDGARDNGIAIVVADKDNRPTGMNEGDVMVYTKSGLKIWLKDSDSEIAINDGTDFAVRFTKLKEVVDELQIDIGNLKSAFSGWVVVPQDGGAALKTATAGWSGTALAKNIDDAKIEEINLP